MTQKPDIRYFFIVIFIVVALFLSLTLQVTKSAPSSEHQGLTDVSLSINEVMFLPTAGNYEWVELVNNGTAAIDIGGYGLTDEDGNWHEFPESLPPVPVGAFVVVIFDGMGSSSDDTDFSDNVAILHSSNGLVDIFEDEADQVALYTGILPKERIISTYCNSSSR